MCGAFNSILVHHSLLFSGDRSVASPERRKAGKVAWPALSRRVLRAPGHEAVGVVGRLLLHGGAVAHVAVGEAVDAPSLVLHHVRQFVGPDLQVGVREALGFEQDDIARG